MPHGWIILERPSGDAVKKCAIVAVLALTGCGLLPRTSTGNEVMDAVLLREDPFGDCVTFGGQTTIFKDVEGPFNPPLQLTAETFQDPDARAAAAAIAVSFEGFVWGNERLIHLGAGDAESCVMDLSMPAYSGDFAFIDYSQPGGGIGVYVFRKDITGWRVVEHKVTGAW